MAGVGGGVSARIDSACRVMTQLAIDPLVLEIGPDGALIVAVMQDHALRTRSRGPYSPDNLPPEAMSMIEWLSLRWSPEPEPPGFTIAGGGPWPGLVMVLPDRGARVHYLVPEEAPWPYPPDPGNRDLGTHIRIALRFLARSLAEAAVDTREGEPPVTLSLAFPADPAYEEVLASTDERFRDVVPSVVPTVEVDRSRCSRRQRAAHDKALRAVAYTDQSVGRLGRTGFTTRIGQARVQDSGG